MTRFRWRFLWPVLAATVCLVVLCVFTAVSLFSQQATVTAVFRENVESRRAAVELEECLADLVALENAHIDTVAPLHDRVRTHLGTLHEVANEPTERQLADRLTVNFAKYLRMWQAMTPPTSPEHARELRKVARFLEEHVLAPCTEFRLYNGRRLEETTEQLERVLRQLARGMAVVAGLGGMAGVLLGFGVARLLSQSIRRLQIQLHDAAGKLTPASHELVFTDEGGFGGLHDEVDRLSGRIEKVVQELHDREREVARAEQLAAVGQLAAGVGHELRNPLTSIKMLVQSALEEGGGGLSSDDLRVIDGEIRRMEGSLRTFLDFARPPKPERRPVELSAVVRDVLDLVRGRAEKQRVTARLEEQGGPLALVADPGQIRQVFVNLVLNALDAMPTGGTLAVVTRRAGGWVEIEISDSGRGVRPDMMPRLFQPFASTKDTGLGLGLVISRRIVEDHGGTIDAGNRPDGGASFFVRLPAGE